MQAGTDTQAKQEKKGEALASKEEGRREREQAAGAVDDSSSSPSSSFSLPQSLDREARKEGGREHKHTQRCYLCECGCLLPKCESPSRDGCTV